MRVSACVYMCESVRKGVCVSACVYVCESVRKGVCVSACVQDYLICYGCFFFTKIAVIE